MIDKEHKVDTITWLIISVICVSLITVFFISQNMELNDRIKQQDALITSYRDKIMSMEQENENIRDHCGESIADLECLVDEIIVKFVEVNPKEASKFLKQKGIESSPR